MANRITIRPRNTTLSIRVKTSASPSQIKLTNTGVRSIEDIGDVDEINVANGSTLVYNPDSDKYEIKQLSVNDLSGDFDIDCGEF